MEENGHEDKGCGPDLRSLSDPEARRRENGHTLNRRGGMIGEREVKISLKAAIISSATPMTSGAMVCAVDPESKVITGAGF